MVASSMRIATLLFSWPRRQSLTPAQVASEQQGDIDERYRGECTAVNRGHWGDTSIRDEFGSRVPKAKEERLVLLSVNR